MSARGAPNRLANETSPYLRQHAHNPVDWYPWGEEAFEKARREDRPIFLSIGYSSCHWCHVMERESFESEEIAALLNERFVSIKVDREERPDVDDVYMTCVQLTTGRGGWPLSAFLLPDRRPFFGGTYFPPDDRHGRAGFRTLLLRLSDAYRTRREQVEESAANIAAEIVAATSVGARHHGKPLDAEALDRLTAALARAFDAEHGGFGGAPKFPPHIALEWLLREGARGNSEAGAIAERTLEAMALGGIHDHLGGGFHRYATDERWLLPHFEKMLPDNGQLLARYAEAFALTGRALYRRVAAAIGAYLLREMRGPEGAFYAATDADSEGEEGKFFVWAEAEVREALGKEDGAFLCHAYRVRPEGNYHDEASGRSTGLNVLHLGKEPTEAEEVRLAPLRETLREVRSRRMPPALDDKRVSGWNALAVSGLAAAARALGDRRFLEAARTAATFLLTTARDADGRLLRTWKDGGRVPAFLEDEAYLANALLDLADADAESGAEWLAEAARAVASLRSRFRGAGEAGFTFTGEGHERLVATTRDLFDKATPSGSGSAVRALVRLALATGERRLAAEARAALDEVSGLLARSPHGTETWHLALADLLEFERRHGPVEAIPTGRSASAARGPVTLELLASPATLRPGGTLSLAVTVRLDEGWTLQAGAPLSIEAWAGADLEVTSRRVPEPATVKHDDGTEDRGYAGVVKAELTLTAAPRAARGERPVTVIVRYVACGAGTCEPEAALSAAVPVTIGPLA